MPAKPESNHHNAARSSLMVLIIGLFLLAMPPFVLSEMTAMTDHELSRVTGHGFSKFSLTHENGLDIARVALNIQASTWSEIDSMKLGYWDNGGGTGWDQEWTGVSLGSESTDMVFTDFVLQAEFVNVDNAATRELKSLSVGFESATGTLSGNFASLSRTNGAARAADGAATYVFNGNPFMLHLNMDGANPGIWFDFGGAVRMP